MLLQIFDVEHGACALLTCDNGTRMLIDCGHNATTGWKPGDHLARLGVTKLDMLMVTNYDEDHVSGIRNLEEKVRVEWLVRNTSVNGPSLLALKSDTGAGPSVKHLAARMPNFVFTQNPRPIFPNVTWSVYNNRYPDFDDENNLSMVVELVVNGFRFLFPGDLERAGWLKLLNNNAAFRDAVKQTDVLVASHHGRENGVCKEIFDVVGCKPVIVVISDDYHQYDTQKTLQYYGSKAKGVVLGAENRKVLTTRCDGEIHFEFTGRAYGWTNCSIHPSKPLQNASTLARLAGLTRQPVQPLKPVSTFSTLAGLPPFR
jgi:beta-lactamase superfamily II metal-dependent hydrolase